MLMTKFSFTLVQTNSGVDITVVRKSDARQVTFFIAGVCAEPINNFMSSITDTQAESYFKK